MLKNYNNVKRRLRLVSQSCGRKEEDIRLIAVSKKQNFEKIRALYELGQRLFAESYVQELEEKRKKLSDLNIKWIYIGRIQSNKLNKLVSLCDEIQFQSFSIFEAFTTNIYSSSFIL